MSMRLFFLIALALATLIGAAVTPCLPLGGVGCGTSACGPVAASCDDKELAGGCCSRPQSSPQPRSETGDACGAAACGPVRARAVTPGVVVLCCLADESPCPRCVCTYRTAWTIPKTQSPLPDAKPDPGFMPVWLAKVSIELDARGAEAHAGFDERPRGPPPDRLALCCRWLI